jgi:hypothetical protein
VCVQGDVIRGHEDADAWSDDDMIHAADVRRPAWEGGATAQLIGQVGFSGGRSASFAAGTVSFQSTEPDARAPDGNAAIGTKSDGVLTS